MNCSEVNVECFYTKDYLFEEKFGKYSKNQIDFTELIRQGVMSHKKVSEYLKYGKIDINDLPSSKGFEDLFLLYLNDLNEESLKNLDIEFIMHPTIIEFITHNSYYKTIREIISSKYIIYVLENNLVQKLWYLSFIDTKMVFNIVSYDSIKYVDEKTKHILFTVIDINLESFLNYWNFNSRPYDINNLGVWTFLLREAKKNDQLDFYQKLADEYISKLLDYSTSMVEYNISKLITFDILKPYLIKYYGVIYFYLHYFSIKKKIENYKIHLLEEE